jgi:hypothetical protein
VLELRNLLWLQFFVFLVLGVLVPCQQINWCEGRDWPDKSGKVLFNLMDLETGGKLSGPRHNLHGFDLGFAGDRETRHVRAEPAWPRFGSGRQIWRTRQSLQRCEWILHLTMPHNGNPPTRRSWAYRVVGDAVIDVHEFISSFSQPVILKLLKLLVPRSFKERTLLYSGRE